VGRELQHRDDRIDDLTGRLSRLYERFAPDAERRGWLALQQQLQRASAAATAAPSGSASGGGGGFAQAAAAKQGGGAGAMDLLEAAIDNSMRDGAAGALRG
jgi:hypothetical protein